MSSQFGGRSADDFLYSYNVHPFFYLFLFFSRLESIFLIGKSAFITNKEVLPKKEDARHVLLSYL